MNHQAGASLLPSVEGKPYLCVEKGLTFEKCYKRSDGNLQSIRVPP